METGEIVRLDNVAFGYDGTPVLREISLSLREGDFLGLIGENGSGKSTLMRGLLGLVKPLSGRMEWTDGARRIGYVPQRGSLDELYPLTVSDIVGMGFTGSRPWYARHHGVKKLIRSQLERVGILSFAKRAYAALSTGQQQRVLIARALATNPKILMADEPTSGVDSVAEADLMDMLRDLNRSSRLTVLLVSHKLLVLQHYATKIILTKEGKATMGSTKEMISADKWIDIASAGL